jgi:hypothetical protein
VRRAGGGVKGGDVELHALAGDGRRAGGPEGRDLGLPDGDGGRERRTRRDGGVDARGDGRQRELRRAARVDVEQAHGHVAAHEGGPGDGSGARTGGSYVAGLAELDAEARVEGSAGRGGQAGEPLDEQLARRLGAVEDLELQMEERRGVLRGVRREEVAADQGSLAAHGTGAEARKGQRVERQAVPDLAQGPGLDLIARLHVEHALREGLRAERAHAGHGGQGNEERAAELGVHGCLSSRGAPEGSPRSW